MEQTKKTIREQASDKGWELYVYHGSFGGWEFDTKAWNKFFGNQKLDCSQIDRLVCVLRFGRMHFSSKKQAIALRGNDAPTIVASDTREHCYFALLKYLQNDGCRIHGLERTAKGDSHDADYVTEYMIIDDGGPFCRFFEEEERQSRPFRLSDSPYAAEPVIKRVDRLTDKQKLFWSTKYDRSNCGELSTRYLYVTKEDQKQVLSISELRSLWLKDSAGRDMDVCYLRDAFVVDIDRDWKEDIIISK